MDLHTQTQAESLIPALEHMKIVTYFEVASIALLIYEHLLTFDQEIALIWPSKWNVTKILYLLTRYLPMLDAVLVLWRMFLLSYQVFYLITSRQKISLHRTCP
ncbi:hypothetical protein CPB85DRAFT_1335370 [Mucidula mucida]|nr:hypothetical protein CPB85DRAFT_1335370 [Mucidula mucida]